MHPRHPPFADSAGVTVDDIAKRLMDCGFHAPTMSWPVAGTLMIEPTESETKAELDRFCDAMLAIRGRDPRDRGGPDRPDNNPLKNAPHTMEDLVRDWDRPYSREQGCFPPGAFRVDKYWPPVNRVDNAYGDRHLSAPARRWRICRGGRIGDQAPGVAVSLFAPVWARSKPAAAEGSRFLKKKAGRNLSKISPRPLAQVRDDETAARAHGRDAPSIGALFAVLLGSHSGS
jgi:hypothetical protein